MGVTKTDLFTPTQNELSAIAKALAHPARIAILEYLVECQSCITGSIVDKVGLAQPTISQHLRELKAVGLVQGTVEGTAVCYCINPEKWHAVQALWNAFFDRYQAPGTTDCC